MDFVVKHGKYNKCIFSEEQKQYIIDSYKSGKGKPKIAKEFGLSHKVIERFLKKNGIETTFLAHRKYNLNETYFDNIDTQNKAYILGFLYADGSISQPKQTVSMSLQEEDGYILEKMRKEIESDKQLEYLDYSNKHDFGYHYKNQYRLLFFSKRMCDSLVSIGMVQNKSLVLEFPKIEEELLPHFIRGYFDGDGSITQSGQINLTSTESFCISIKEILENKLGINKLLLRDASCHNGITRSLQLNIKSQVKIFLDWIYKDAEMYLERKYDRYIKFYHKNAA